MAYHLELEDNELRCIIRALKFYRDCELPHEAKAACDMISWLDDGNSNHERIAKREMTDFARNSVGIAMALEKAEEAYD